MRKIRDVLRYRHSTDLSLEAVSERRKDRREDEQRPRRDGRGKAVIPQCIQTPPLHRADGGIL